MACAHTTSLTASSKAKGSCICENKEKIENQFVASSLYMSRRLLVFLGNRIAKVGSGDVELLKLFADVCYALGVDCAHVVLTGVFCDVICVTVLGIEGTVH
jgi:predicted Kef-type K+ transport protein